MTFAVYGERGSVDVLGWEPATGSAAVIEVKTSIASFEHLQRSMDVKVRLSSGLVLERFGQRSRWIGRILVVDDTATNRRRVERQPELFAVALPVGSVSTKRWLRRPSGELRGLCFLSPSDCPESYRGSPRYPSRPSATSPLRRAGMSVRGAFVALGVALSGASEGAVPGYESAGA